MRISINYGWKTFGNGNVPQTYRVTVNSSEYGLFLRISFDTSVRGIGGFTENKSRVSSASLNMTREHAKVIAEAILQSLNMEKAEVVLEFGEKPEENTETK